jgi:hypothetical protein
MIFSGRPTTARYARTSRQARSRSRGEKAGRQKAMMP